MGEHKSKKCTVCGEKTDNTATVYIGTEKRSEGGRVSYDYRTLEKPICPDCVNSHYDRDPLRWLFPLVLQLGWFELARARGTFLGIMGLVFAVYGLVKLVTALGDLAWRRFWPDKQEPAWLAGQESFDDKASAALKDALKKEYNKGKDHLETVREYLRRHPAAKEG